MKHYIVSSSDDSMGNGTILIIPEAELVSINHEDEDGPSIIYRDGPTGEEIEIFYHDYRVIECDNLIIDVI